MYGALNRALLFDGLCFQVYMTPILSASQEIMAKERATTFVSEVFWNLREISTHHRRMLGSLLSRQRDQHPIVQSVADIILDCKLALGTLIIPSDPSNVRCAHFHSRL